MNPRAALATYTLSRGTSSASCEEIVPPVPTAQADTIGAGDSHIGSVIACLKKGDSLHDAIAKANRVSSAVVATSSAILPDEEFAKLAF